MVVVIVAVAAVVTVGFLVLVTSIMKMTTKNNDHVECFVNF